MATLSFVLTAFLDPVQAGIVLAVLDPVQAGIVLAIILIYRGTLPIIVAGVIAAVASETVMALAADGYVWGEFILPRVVSSLMQAAVLCWIVRAVRSIRVGGVASTGDGRAPGTPP